MNGKEMAARRRAAGMTQTELASALGTTENTVRRLETGLMDIGARWRSHLQLLFTVRELDADKYHTGSYP